jgi:hypothetical protein
MANSSDPCSERTLNSGDSKVGRQAWLFRRGSEFNPPACERMTVREAGGVHFNEIEVFGIPAFESLFPTELKCVH